eukprot:65036-Amphidinium_carterae.1
MTSCKHPRSNSQPQPTDRMNPNKGCMNRHERFVATTGHVMLLIWLSGLYKQHQAILKEPQTEVSQRAMSTNSKRPHDPLPR